MRHHRLNFAELAWEREYSMKYFLIFLIFLTSELRWTLTGVLVHLVSAGPSVLTHMIGTVINIGRAVLTNKPWMKIF